MDSRLVKQLVYGSIYLVFFGLILTGIYFLWLKPSPTCFDNKQNGNETGIDCGGSCLPCAIQNLSPIKTSWIKYFSTGLESSINLSDLGNQTIVVLEIQNPNLDYGAQSFKYNLNIHGKSGELLKTISGESLIYPAEIKYLLELTEINAANISNVKIDFPDYKWFAKNQFSAPSIQTREIRTDDGDASNPGVKMRGFLNNNNPYPLSRVKIIAFLENQGAELISAAKTELENLSSYSETSFLVSFPRNTFLIKESTPGPKTFIFTRDLTVGSTGKDVAELQRFLKNQGLFERELTEYFGNVTRDALIKYQGRAGITPASGYFGPKTREDINAQIPKTSPIPPVASNEADPQRTRIYVEAIR